MRENRASSGDGAIVAWPLVKIVGEPFAVAGDALDFLKPFLRDFERALSAMRRLIRFCQLANESIDKDGRRRRIDVRVAIPGVSLKEPAHMATVVHDRVAPVFAIRATAVQAAVAPVARRKHLTGFIARWHALALHDEKR